MLLADHYPLNILVVEDNSINQKLMLDILLIQGYTCEAVASGFDAIERVKQNDYDLILMDIQMPGMSGEATMQAIRQLPLKKFPKIIAVTAYAMAEDRIRYLNSGMDGYLSKPFRINELVEEIKRVIAPS